MNFIPFGFFTALVKSIVVLLLRNKPFSIKEKFNDDGVLIEREEIYRK